MPLTNIEKEPETPTQKRTARTVFIGAQGIVCCNPGDTSLKSFMSLMTLRQIFVI
jgi:hypothetical protein